MAYLTQADLLERLSTYVLTQLTDDDKLGVVNSAIVTACIATAGAEIDGYLQQRHLVPVSPVPTLVKSWALTLTVYHIYARKNGLTDDLIAQRKDVLARLKEVALGTLSLGIEPTPAASAQASQGEVLSSESEWSREKLGNW